MSSGIVEPSQSGSSQEKDREQSSRVPASAPRQRLVQKLLDAGSDLPAFINGLIETQAVVVAGTEAVAFLIEPDQERRTAQLRLVKHIRPDESAEDVRRRAVEEFAKIVSGCVEQQKDGVIQIGDPTTDKIHPQFCLVTLLRAENQIVAVSAVIARAADMQRAEQRLSSMQLIAGYFDIFGLRHGIEQARAISKTNQDVLQLATSVATAEGFEAASMSLCNELAARTGATRVAIGWVVGDKIKLKAMSHTEQFDKKQELAVMMVAVMEECWDNQEIVQYEPQGGSSENVTRAAGELSRTQGGVSVLSLPLRRIGDIVGVITLEFNPTKKLEPQAATSLAVAVELLAPQLFDRYQNDRWWITKTGISIRETTKLATGPKHMLAKVIITAVVLGLTFISIYRPVYNVAAPFTFTSVERRIISAPFDGFVGSKINVKPGDKVKAGDILLEMETYELVQKKTQAESTSASKNFEYQRLSADPNKSAEAMQAREEAKAAKAEADYYADQIDHAIVKAPFDGVVLSGDWRDKRNTPVRKGDELFKVSQGNSLMLEINVAERDIQYIHDGDPKNPQKGMLATSSLPNVSKKFHVDHIVPLAKQEQGANVFTVYGIPDEPDPQWRDGLQGEARIESGRKPLIWVWTHRLVDWIRVKTWM